MRAMRAVLFFFVFIAFLVCLPVVADAITMESMQALGREAASGDTGAIDKIEQAHDELFQNINYQTDADKARANFALVKAAFDIIGSSVKGSDASDPAYRSLVYALGKPSLVDFTAMALGTAAASGHQPSLDILVHYKEHRILPFTAVLAVQGAALKNNKGAVDFLIGAINDDSMKPLRLEASQGLATAVNQGNDAAKQATAKAKAYAASRGVPGY
jgi:hypothetical protein